MKGSSGPGDPGGASNVAAPFCGAASGGPAGGAKSHRNRTAPLFRTVAEAVKRQLRRALPSVAGVAALWLVDHANAQNVGVAADAILFGQSAAFSGPAEELGMNMRLGIRAAFDEHNKRGGVHDRQLLLTTLDDAYEPEAAIANTRRLIHDEGVFALIGAVGTPTSVAAAPVAADAGVPYVAPFTGAAFLREANGRGTNVINLRASYDDETEAMVAHLTGDLDIQRIAVMYQDDSFGRAGHAGAERALTARGMAPVAVGVYPRNTSAVKTALLDVRAGDPEAVILVGAYEPVAALIAWSRHIGFDPVFITISFVGSNALARELGSAGAGVYVTQVVPFPVATEPGVVASYTDALTASAPDSQPGFVSLEGYLAGRLAIAALELCGREADRTCFLNTLGRQDRIDIDGFELRFGANDNQGSNSVFLTVIDEDGRYRPIETMERR